MRLLVALVMTFLFFTISHAQILNPDKVKFGKISDEELTMTTYEADAEAEAVVLYDKGALRMEFSDRTRSFQYVLERHLRIKILKKSGTRYANFSFSLQQNGTIREALESIKGFTYNQVDGKSEATKLTKEGVFTEEVTDYFSLQKIAFPQVKEGSVIELKYSLRSDFLFQLPTWYFQKEIPVDYTFYEAIIPEYFVYNLDMKGFASESLTQNEIGEQGASSIYIKGQTSRTNTGGMLRGGNVKTRTTPGRSIPFSTNIYRWTAVEVPKLKKEAFSPLLSNYFFRVAFELSTTNFPFTYNRDYSQTWEGVIKTYRNSRLEAYEKPRKKVKDLTNEWVGTIDDRDEKLRIIYENLQQTIQWGGYFTRYVRNTPAELLKLKTATSGELNYMLLSLLRAANFAVEPVLVSTRSNGALSYAIPSLVQFNHVIVKVTLGPDKFVLLDATDDNLPYSLLSKHNLNNRGRLIRESSSEWISLAPVTTDKVAVQLQLELTEDGQLAGTVKIKEEGYGAIDFCDDNEQEKDIKAYLNKWAKANLSELEIVGYDDLYQDIVVTAKVDFTEQVTAAADFIYLPSVLVKHYDENPFKAESRDLPVDFVVPQDYIYVTVLSLPEGMTLDEIPESVNFALPDKKASYSIRYVDMGDKLQIIEKFSIKETFYNGPDYAALRTFFDLAIERQVIPLVVKKG